MTDEVAQLAKKRKSFDVSEKDEQTDGRRKFLTTTSPFNKKGSSPRYLSAAIFWSEHEYSRNKRDGSINFCETYMDQGALGGWSIPSRNGNITLNNDTLVVFIKERKNSELRNLTTWMHIARHMKALHAHVTDQLIPTNLGQVFGIPKEMAKLMSCSFPKKSGSGVPHTL